MDRQIRILQANQVSYQVYLAQEGTDLTLPLEGLKVKRLEVGQKPRLMGLVRDHLNYYDTRVFPPGSLVHFKKVVVTDSTVTIICKEAGFVEKVAKALSNPGGPKVLSK